MNNNIESLIKGLPYFERENMPEQFYERFRKIREIIVTHSEPDAHMLNKDNVTGLWYFTELAYEETAPIILLRTPVKNRADYNSLREEIFDILHEDDVYDFYEDVLGEDGMLKGVHGVMYEEVANGRVLTIYDRERE